MAGTHEDHVRWMMNRARDYATENKVPTIFSFDPRLSEFVIGLLAQFAAQMMSEARAPKH